MGKPFGLTMNTYNGTKLVGRQSKEFDSAEALYDWYEKNRYNEDKRKGKQSEDDRESVNQSPEKVRGIGRDNKKSKNLPKVRNSKDAA